MNVDALGNTLVLGIVLLVFFVLVNLFFFYKTLYYLNKFSYRLHWKHPANTWLAAALVVASSIYFQVSKHLEEVNLDQYKVLQSIVNEDSSLKENVDRYMSDSKINKWEYMNIMHMYNMYHKGKENRAKQEIREGLKGVVGS